MSALYNDATLLMIPSGVRDGKLYSVLPGSTELGSDLVTNGGFDTDSDWTKGGGSTTTIANGKANFINTTSGDGFQQDGIFTSGKIYKITFTVSNYTQGAVKIRYPFNMNNSISANGTYTEYGVANDSGNETNLFFQCVGATTFSIDNISAIEVDKLPGDLDFSRGNNLAATRINGQGLVEKGRENVLLHSNQFDTTWVATNIDETSGEPGYDGTNDAWELEVTNPLGSAQIFAEISQNVTLSGVMTASVYAKQGTTNWIRISTAVGSSTCRAWFNLDQGVVGTTAAGTNKLIEAKIESAGNDYFRCSLTLRDGIDSLKLFVARADGDNEADLGDSVYIQDFQLEQGLVATDYIETGPETAQVGITQNMPRLDYSDSATCPCVLLEPSRQNKILYSESFSTQWNTSSDSVTVEGGYTAPDGTNSAYKITNVSNGSLSTDPVAQTDARSIFAKTTSGTGTVNLLTNNSNANTLFTITNEWQRFEITSANSTAPTTFYAVDFRNASATLNEVIIWGAQSEVGDYVTSYIPTHGTAVTRGFDLFQNTYLSNLIGTGDTTFFFDFDYDVVAREGNSVLFKIFSGPSNSVGIRGFSDVNRTLQIFSAGAFVNNIEIASSSNTSHKIAIRVSGALVEVFYNGAKLTNTITGLSTYAWSELRASGENSFLCESKEVTVFPTALSDNECINLTNT